ncbi:MAG: hypothetical protein ACJ73S_21250 [Mycobacteriales bacterium]
MLTSVQGLVTAALTLGAALVTVAVAVIAHFGGPATHQMAGVATPVTDDAPPGHAAERYGHSFLSGSEPVSEDGYGGAADATLAHQQYPHSVEVRCLPAGGGGGYAEWTVGGAGNPRRFRATVGVADDAAGASQAVADLSFTDQDRHPLGDTVTVSLGHPQPVSLPLPANTVRLRVSCVSHDLSGGPDRPPPGPPPAGLRPPPPPPGAGPPPGRDFFATLGDAALGR